MEMIEIDTFYQAKGNRKWYFSDGVEAIGPYETEAEARVEAALYDFYTWRHDFHQGDGDDPDRRQRGSESERGCISSQATGFDA